MFLYKLWIEKIKLRNYNDFCFEFYNYNSKESDVTKDGK